MKWKGKIKGPNMNRKACGLVHYNVEVEVWFCLLVGGTWFVFFVHRNFTIDRRLIDKVGRPLAWA